MTTIKDYYVIRYCVDGEIHNLGMIHNEIKTAKEHIKGLKNSGYPYNEYKYDIIHIIEKTEIQETIIPQL